MPLALVSTSVFEATHVSIAIVILLSATVAFTTLSGIVRAYFMLIKKHKEDVMRARIRELQLQAEHLSASSELTVQRKGSNKTIKLPPHYTAHAADALLEFLAH
jgi:hypothetical protein